MFAQKTIVQPILVKITLFILKLIGLSFTWRKQNKANKRKFCPKTAKEIIKILDNLWE